ncbi:MAG: hypothetical protein R3C19_08820 [Planctomycetaceae bacterium]
MTVTPSSQPFDANSPEALLSAVFDGESTADFTTAGDKPGHELLSSSRREQLLSDWKSLSRSLKQIPISAAGDVREAVRREIEAERRKSAVPAPVSEPSTGRRDFRWIAVSVSVAALALFAVQLNVSRDARTDGSADFVLNRTFVDSDSGPAVAAESGESARPDVAGSMAIAETQSPNVEPDWQIVVVTIRDGSAQTAKETFEAIARQHGLDVQRKNGSGDGPVEFPLGILLSSVQESNELLSSISPQIQAPPYQWNPVCVGSLPSSELKMRFLKSMETPTLSDEYFGEMLAVVPGSADDDVAVASIAGDAAHGDRTKKLAPAFAEGRRLPLPGSEPTASGGRVLVVFRMQQLKDPVPLVPGQGRLIPTPGKPANPQATPAAPKPV